MMTYFFSHVKSWIYSVVAVVIAVLFAVVKIKSHQVESLKTKAIKSKLEAAQKQREQADKTAKALETAHAKGVERVEQLKKNIAAGNKRTGFK